ncbi:hypothetical protein DWB85_18580 [Seongchinamella sediminis]|uniref:ParB-like N-terminal domain-containing protein n=1 Tax=Seongchinamella sediminis TaxID=2283635 RepID=A0A3L7DUR1_9GAMM|nr:ParB/Srx family N-terminal domain-containing protein [Seongchinamella sediminis]RLQ20249.1 hypothetical protein DWB85_18580 [Seongchinamella sediminis]
MRIDDITVSLEQLLLDPNNYRLDYSGSQPITPDHEILEQQTEIQRALEKERLGELRDSILQNGFLEIDRIVVRHLNCDTNHQYYVVVEGNRRTAALKSLVEDHRKGLTNLDKKIIDKAAALNVVLVDAPQENIKEHTASLMGIRHVSGPKRWTGYQSARLIADLLDDANHTLSQIGSLLGITAHEAGRRLRGYRAYMQMLSDPVYGQYVTGNSYTLLLEFLAPQKAGRDWLGWNDSEMRFENSQARERLYQAITKIDSNSAEISNPGEAREFLKHLAQPRHREMIDQGRRLEELPPLPSEVDQLSRLRRVEDFFDSLGSLSSEEYLVLERIGVQVSDILDQRES